MNSRLGQAALRLVVVGASAAVAAILANATILQGAIEDPVQATLAFSIFTAVLQAILKYLGGVTTQPAPSAEGVRGAAPKGEQPNIFAV